MPTYDYACTACEHEFEAFHSITAKPLRKCPACGKLKLKKLIGIGAGVIFKGSGFYETDYRSDSYKKAAKAESTADKPATSDSTAAKAEASSSTAANGTAATSASSDSSASKPAAKSADKKPADKKPSDNSKN